MPVSAPLRGAALGGLLAALAAGSAAAAGPVIVYSASAPANAVHDGAAGLAGIRDAYRQAPAEEDPRYPTARRVGKIGGRELVALDAAAMAARVRAELRRRDVGDLVAVDEIEAARATPDRLAELDRALSLLGPDAERLVFYVSPGTVSQVGRVDRRSPLPDRYARLVQVLARGGHAYLLLYHGDGNPFTRDEMARDLTGWQARWPAARADRLHVMTGPERTTGQAEIWDRVRATPAGRALLASGPAVWGLRSGGEGLRWLAQYRAFLTAPTATPAGGEARVPTGGGLAIALPSSRLRPGATVRVTVGRPGRATVVLTRAGGAARRIRAITGPANAAVRLPLDVRPGRYTLRAVLLGDGLRDVATAAFTMLRR
ncbi:MAG: hypothetical protein IT200_11450 [Thermoleophilia bacterium]|nr:hypothetical protein [Thermoleophilia bacterium]